MTYRLATTHALQLTMTDDDKQTIHCAKNST